MYVYCPADTHFVNTLICLYRCPNSRRKKCKEFIKNFEAIVNQEIEEYYLVTYGAPKILIPKEIKKKRLEEKLTEAALEHREKREKGAKSEAKKRAEKRAKDRQKQRRSRRNK